MSRLLWAGPAAVLVAGALGVAAPASAAGDDPSWDDRLGGGVRAAGRAAQTPLTPAQVHANLDGALAYNTVHTVLSRLCDKDLVRRTTHEGRPAYLPVQPAADWAAGRMRAVLDGGGDRGAILRRFVSGLDGDDEQLLRAALRSHHSGQAPPRRRTPPRQDKS